MLTKQVLNQNYKHKKCYKFSDNKIKVCATSATYRGSDSTYRWDYANSSHGLSVMSAPPLSPSSNGSTSSILSSEDSMSNIYGFPLIQQTQHFALTSKPSTSTTSAYSSIPNKQIKVCRVCGDRAKSYHFGGISCDSCKAFFRRSVQNDAYRNFHCPYDMICEITISSRKSCQLCRFNKCLSIGMEKSWVMTEEERMQMLKNRIEKRKQEDDEEVTDVRVKVRHHNYEDIDSKYKPDISRINGFLTEQEVKLIENVVNLHLKCSKDISFNTSSNGLNPSRTDILNIFFTAIQQFTLFAQRSESFNCIQTQDKQILLKDGVLELCFLKGAFSYNIKGKYWPFEDNSGVIPSDSLQVMVSKDLLEKQMQFIETIKRLSLDVPTYILLSLIVLLSPDREGLSDDQLVQNEQEKYLILLKNYMNWRYGTECSRLLYPKLLLKLTDLRELSEAHTDYKLLLGPQELQQLQRKLSTLNIALRTDNMNSNPIVCDSKFNANAVNCSTQWTIRMCATNDCFNDKSLYADEELSTSSEGSEKLSSD